MKNILPVSLLLSLFLVSGCTSSVGENSNQSLSQQNGNGPTVEPVNQNQNKPEEFPLATGVCSESNPPRLGEDKGGNGILNHCGRLTGYLAYEFKAEHLILFIESIWNEKTEQHTYTAKLISTLAPFAETTLADGIEIYDFVAPVVLQNNLYVWRVEADGPGSLTRVFAFRPSDKAYVYFQRVCSGYICDVRVNLLSSVQKAGMDAVLVNDAIMDQCVSCKLKANEIAIRVNDRVFTKAEVEKGLAKDVIPIFQCDATLHYSPGGEVDVETHLTELLAEFPRRLPCWRYPYSVTRKVLGYFDLEKNEFVTEK